MSIEDILNTKEIASEEKEVGEVLVKLKKSYKIHLKFVEGKDRLTKDKQTEAQKKSQSKILKKILKDLKNTLIPL